MIRNTINRSCMHNKWFINDPDCLLLRDSLAFTECEIVSIATVKALSGGSFIVSDDLEGTSSLSISIMYLHACVYLYGCLIFKCTCYNNYLYIDGFFIFPLTHTSKNFSPLPLPSLPPSLSPYRSIPQAHAYNTTASPPHKQSLHPPRPHRKGHV